MTRITNTRTVGGVSNTSGLSRIDNTQAVEAPTGRKHPHPARYVARDSNVYRYANRTMTIYRSFSTQREAEDAAEALNRGLR